MERSFFNYFGSRYWVKHVLYWSAVVLFFALVWGSSNADYFRNFLIQVCCLPSRMLLVYITLLYLFPKFFDNKKYVSFFAMYCLCVLLISVLIQRPLFLYFIQPNLLPEYTNDTFFVVSEITNTALDINIAAMLPIAYTYLRRIRQLELNNAELNHQNESLRRDVGGMEDRGELYIELKVDKGIKRVHTPDILYVESLRNYCSIKLVDSEITVLKTLTSIQELLPETQFIRIHRSFLINKQRVNSVSASSIEINDTSLPVGRTYREEVKTKML